MPIDTFATLAPFGTYLNATNVESPLPFKDHWQFPILLDALCRKDQHHLALNNHFTHKMQLGFLKALLMTATHNSLPEAQRQMECIYLDQPVHQYDFLQALKHTLQTLQQYSGTLIIALREEETWGCFKKQAAKNQFSHALLSLWQHPRCRLILFANGQTLTPSDLHPAFRHQFTFIQLADAEENDLLALLKQESRELAQFHQVSIADEQITHAYALAKRYISTEESVDKAMLLLDSAAARASALESQTENTITTALLLNVLSTWTQIPASHLLFNQFNAQDFTHAMQQRIFGQDMALDLIAERLQQAQANLQKKSGPFCTLLLAGANHTGKKTVGVTLTDYIFKQVNLFFSANITASNKILGRGISLTELKFKRATDHRYFNLKTILIEKPYAVVFINNITAASNELLDGLQEIIETGFWHDATGHEYDCRQMILLLGTTLGAEQINQLTTHQANELSTEEQMSLLQLVLNMQEQKPASLSHLQTFSSEELIKLVSTEIKTHLPQPFLHNLTIIPFQKLNKAAIENIVRIKLKSLSKMLSAHHGIEMGYAAEVIRYLTHIVSHQTEQAEINIEQALQPLYFLIEQSITNQKRFNTTNQSLFLQLNETGHALRCDWVNESERALF